VSSESTVPVSDPSAKVQDIIDWDRWSMGALGESFQEGLAFWKLYLSDRKDHRKAHERSWRALTHEPYPFTIVEGKVRAVSDTLNSTDPNVQASGIGDEDVPVARKVEKLIDYTLVENQWRMRCEELVRESAIQGTAALKVVFRHDTSRVRLNDPEAEALFDQTMAEAKAQGLEVPEDPNEYEAFRKESGIAELPPNPRAQFEEVTTFKAPELGRVSLTDLRFDPAEGDWSKQRRVAQLIIKPMKWVTDRAGDDPSLPFRPVEVERAINAMAGDRWDQYQAEIARMMGHSAANGYYGRKDLCTLLEVFDPEDEEMPWKLMLNNLELINKDAFPPYGHGGVPIHLFRNLPQPGAALGMSELKPARKQIETLWALYDLLVDHISLNTMGVYTRLQEMGIPEVSRVLRPGGTISLPRLDALKKLDLGSVHPDIWKLLPYLKDSIDQATVSPQVRGQQAQIGRVSANESAQRFGSASLGPKTAAVRFEEEFRRPLKQVLWTWYHQGDPEILVKIGGPGADQYSLSVSKSELLQALAWDFRFRGPTQAANRELSVQQAMQWFTTFGALLPIHRQLAFAAQTYELQGLQGRNQVLPDTDIEMALAAAGLPPEADPSQIDPVTGLPLDPNVVAPPMPAPAPAPEAAPAPAPEPAPEPAPKKRSRRKRTVERDGNGEIATIIDENEEE